jgi:hypothetical protein
MARDELNDRYTYKNYLKIIVHDKENNIDMDNILSIGGKYYTFVSYHRNCKKTIVTGDIEELLLTHQSYDPIKSYALESSEGDSTSSSSTGITTTGIHNYLVGIQGGNVNEYYHLTAAEHAAIQLLFDPDEGLRGYYWNRKNKFTHYRNNRNGLDFPGNESHCSRYGDLCGLWHSGSRFCCHNFCVC